MTRSGPPADAPSSGPVPCPACREPVPAEGAHRPFCSVRCKMVDLGCWLNEEYRVAGESAIGFGDVDEDVAQALREWKEPGDERDA